jgi:transcriptional regulator with XRE-family HTH domain
MALHKKRGLPQRQLARDLGVSQNYILTIEANAHQPGPKLQDVVRSQVF